MEDLGSAEDFFTLAEELPETEDLLESDDDAPIIKLINAMLAEAIKEGASDIHIETFEKDLVIRFHVDGTLHEMLHPVVKLARAGIAYQGDGATGYRRAYRRMAVLRCCWAVGRLTSVYPPCLPHRERVVLRLLDKNRAT